MIYWVIILLFRFLKKIILGSLLIYSFDFFAESLNVCIPINLCTVLLVSFFDIPALICLILFFMIF